MRRIRFAISIVIGCSFASAVEAEAGRFQLPAPVDEALWWLPNDTETVMVARGPFKVGDLVPRGPEGGDLINTLRSLTMMHLPVHSKRDLIGDREVSLAISGGRRFRLGDAATGMMIPCDGADIVIFRDDLGPLGEELLAPGEGAKSRKEIIAGQRVIVEEIENPNPAIKRVELLYRVRPKPNVLIYATDRDYLAGVLERMATRAKTRALPADLPEWKHLDPSARFWGVRHFDRKKGAADLTSPFARLEPNLILVPLDEQAVGFVATIPPDQPEVLRLTYLRGEGKLPAGYKRFWERLGSDKYFKTRQDQPGTFVVTFAVASLADPDLRAGVMLLMMTVLGHAFII